MPLSRRAFLRQSALAGGFTMAGPLEALTARAASGSRWPQRTNGYGSLSPVKDGTTGLELLALPDGFRYLSYGWTGDPLQGGKFTPAGHDGMAAFQGPGSRVLLIRNHEESAGPTFDSSISYDEGAPGGTTTLEFDAEKGVWIGGRTSIAGTHRNCAGGPAPWGVWLTCEESVAEPAADKLFKKPHGYIFEVPVEGKPTCQPLVAMGRFVHEAVAVDPATGIVYETEDAGTAGLYRFIPKTPGQLLHGGKLEMLAIEKQPKFDTRTKQKRGVEYPVTWVPIDQPDRAHEKDNDGRGVYTQGNAHGGATFARLEGAWHGGGKIFITATSGGDAKAGQVWELDPARSMIRLVFESPGHDVLSMPDNLCVSPRGGLVICEDGNGTTHMHSLTLDGRIFRFARNTTVIEPGQGRRAGDFTGSEFAGATFSPDGKWLFFNMQTPGITFAVTGPWERGAL